MRDPCTSVSKLLEKYFDREVTDKEKLLVEGHLQDCPACQGAVRSMEELRTFIKIPVEEAAQEEDFPWVWQKIEREIHLQEKRTSWPSLRSWLDLTPLLKRKVWIPAVAIALGVLLIAGQLIFKKTPSYSGLSVIEYAESQTNNIMIYESEKGEMSVIWIFEGPEDEVSES